MPLEFYAHRVEGKPTSQWHWLEEHLKGTAELAEYLKVRKKDWIFEGERGIINKGIMGFSKGFIFVGHKANED